MQCASEVLQQYTCECGRCYKYRRGLHEHRLYEYSKDPQFACTQCTYKVKRKQHLCSHIANKHSADSAVLNQLSF